MRFKEIQGDSRRFENYQYVRSFQKKKARPTDGVPEGSSDGENTTDNACRSQCLMEHENGDDDHTNLFHITSDVNNKRRCGFCGLEVRYI